MSSATIFEKDEDCTICLDLLFPKPSSSTRNSPFANSTITRLQPCQHHYHTECIHHWMGKSNTCPTCRHDYEILELVDMTNQIISQKQATKIEVVPSIEEYFEENLEMRDYIMEDYYQEAEEEEDDDEEQGHYHGLRMNQRLQFMVSNANTCVLCDESVINNTSYSSSLISCIGCTSSFHKACLGLISSPIWICPLCDAENRTRNRRNDNNNNNISMFRRSRNSARTNRMYNNNRRNLNEIIQRANELQQLQEQQQQQQSIQENDHQFRGPEIDHSWNAFEIARKDIVERDPIHVIDPIPQTVLPGGESTNISNGVSEEPRKFKLPSRRNRINQRQVQEQTHLLPSQESSSSSSSSSSSTQTNEKRANKQRTLVVSSILTQMRSNRTRNSDSTILQDPETFPTSTTTISKYPNDYSSALESSTHLSTAFSSSSSKGSLFIHQDTTLPTIITTSTLSYEQKQYLRNIIRDVLKPYYTNSTITEERYTCINRKLSHVLYERSLKDGVLFETNDYNLDIVKELVCTEINKGERNSM